MNGHSFHYYESVISYLDLDMSLVKAKPHAWLTLSSSVSLVACMN